MQDQAAVPTIIDANRNLRSVVSRAVFDLDTAIIRAEMAPGKLDAVARQLITTAMDDLRAALKDANDALDADAFGTRGEAPRV